VPDAPGLGAEPLADVLASRTVRRATYHPE